MMKIAKKYGVYPSKFPEAQDKFVCWIDIMGIGNTMKNSIKVASNFMFRLHAIVLDSIYSNNLQDDLYLYPIMDGIYITSSNAENIEKCIVSVFKILTKLFIEVELHYRYKKSENYNFLVKSSISYGKLNEGRHINSNALPYFAEHPDNSYINRLMIGEPIINAYENEKRSSPFGIFIDDKAKQFFEPTLFSEQNPNDFYWWKSNHNTFEISTHKELFSCILDYYEFYIGLSNMHRGKYKPEKIEEHLSRVAEYFLLENSEIDIENRAEGLLKSINVDH